MVERNCFECEFFDNEQQPPAEPGICRFLPPRVTSASSQDAWPRTGEGEWCGEFVEAAASTWYGLTGVTAKWLCRCKTDNGIADTECPNCERDVPEKPHGHGGPRGQGNPNA